MFFGFFKANERIMSFLKGNALLAFPDVFSFPFLHSSVSKQLCQNQSKFGAKHQLSIGDSTCRKPS
jgi:hypothetical protein